MIGSKDLYQPKKVKKGVNMDDGNEEEIKEAVHNVFKSMEESQHTDSDNVVLNSEREKLTNFGTGATRCSDADEERFDLISPFFLQRLAKVMAEGAKTHGEDNWRLGIPISVTLNHLERHLNLWKQEVLSGNKNGPDDHLAKVAFGVMALCHYQAVGPEMWRSLCELDKLRQYLGK